MTIKCCSLRSLDKKLQFQELITEHNPNTICGTESHLNADYHTAEVFPPDFNVTRKERPAAGDGGVFIAAHSKYLATCESSFDSDCEIVWMKMNIQGVKPLNISCYYRPSDSNASNVYELSNSLYKIPKRGSNMPNIFLTGDFNVPDIDSLADTSTKAKSTVWSGSK